MQNTNFMNPDLFGRALLDYLSNNQTKNIITYSSLDEIDTLPLSYLFRTYDEMPRLEKKALKQCSGKVLDVGCGAGSHSLWLQKKGFDVTALDVSEGAIAVCKKRGVKKTLQQNVLDTTDNDFDTLLLLMNGLGIVGKLNKLNHFLNHLKTLIRPSGQIILDSSDIIYMFEQNTDGGPDSYWEVPENVDYYGEVTFQMEHKGEKGPVFDWLYLDYETLKKYASNCGFETELLFQGEHYDYLAKLTLA